MILTAGMLLALLFVCDLSRRPVWRHRLVLTLVLTAVSIAIFGVLVKLGGVPVMQWFWPAEKINPANNFALFRYRGNAGAYLNLALPLLLAGTWLSFQRRRHPSVKAGWICASFILIIAVQLNPSRASWLIAWLLLGLSILAALLAAWRAGTWSWEGNAKTAAAYGTAILLLATGLGALLLRGPWETSWNRLQRQGLDVELRRPVPIYRAMSADAGWTGFGPGTFSAIFPAYQASHPYATDAEKRRWSQGFWRYAHHDYYQTVIEWGYAGGAAWMMVIVGGLALGARRLARHARGRREVAEGFCILLALTGLLLHAVVDFPWQVASIQLSAVVLLGLCWTAPPSPHASTPPRPRP
jgi:hypothetical protein